MKVKGICGSGILDLLAELYRSGVIMKSGVFNKKALKDHPRFRINPDNRQPEFVLAWADESSIDKDIVVTQKDIRQIQLGKGALYAGCKLMVKRMGLEKVDKVKIAGAFGTHVDRTKALIMGLFPDCPVEMIESVGNAAGDGCRAALLNTKKRVEANWCSRNVEYIELTVEDTFQQEFMEAMQLPHMTDPFPHLEGVVPEDILKQLGSMLPDSMTYTCMRVDPGICGFPCLIRACKDKNRAAAIEISGSECKQIQALAKSLTRITLPELFTPLTRNIVYVSAEKAGCHPACPIPAAIIKTAEVAMATAVPKDVQMGFEKCGQK
jgi:hypothetical protein